MSETMTREQALAKLGMHETGEVGGFSDKGEPEFKDASGCSWFGLESVLTETFKWCGCGVPEAVLLLIAGALDWIATPYDAATWDATYAKQKAWWAEHGGTGAEYLVYYTLDAAGLTEHGGSVPGWLTLKGAAFKMLIDEYRAANSEAV